MKLLFDQNISFRITKFLSPVFKDSIHVSECGLMNSEDAVIWNFAKQNSFAIVTFDADFYDISILEGFPPKIVWIRTGNLSTKELAHFLNGGEKAILDFLHESNENSCLQLDK